MSQTMTTPAPGNRAGHPGIDPGSRAARARDLLAAEWIKTGTVRATYWTLLATAVAAIAVGVLIAHQVASVWAQLPPDQRAGFDPLGTSFRGFALAQLTMATLGVLAISSEYSTGLIRTTFAAVPQRRAVLAAKAAVTGAIALAVGELIALSSFEIVQAVLAGTHTGIPLTGPGALRAITAAGFYLLVVALIGAGLGTLIRHTAGATAAAFGLLFLLPQMISLLPSPWDTNIGKFLPANAITQLTQAHPSTEGLSTPWALAILAAYPAAILICAGYALTHRDT